MPQVGPAEILVILLVGLLVFGPTRLPEIGRQVGRAMREVKKFQDTIKGELDQVLHLHEEDSSSAPAYTSSEAAIAAAEAPPALPASSGADHREDTPAAPHAQSRFRTPNGATPNGSNGNGAVANGSAPAPAPPAPAVVPRAVEPSGARPPSRFRAPGPRPTI